MTLGILYYWFSVENIYLILFGTRGIRNYYLSSRYVLKINIYFLRLLIKLRSRLYPWLKYDGFVIRPINHFIMQTTINLLVTYGRVYHQSIHFEITLYLFSNWDKLRWILVNAIQIDMKHKLHKNDIYEVLRIIISLSKYRIHLSLVLIFAKSLFMELIYRLNI